MDLSEFKPPVRLSMTDEEIFVALGNAEASEDGLAKAMAIVEEQANLREHDNKLFAEWVERMRNSESPLAQIALENVERAKHGLEPLPLVLPVSPAPAVTERVVAEPAYEEPMFEEPVMPEVLPEEEIQEIMEQVDLVEVEIPVVDVVNTESDDLFEALLADAASEATGSIPVTPEVEVPAVTYSHEIIEEPVSAFATSADEDALVVDEKKAASGWWNTLAVIVNTTGILLPVVIAFLAANAEVSFGTAVAGFGLGALGQVGLFVASHFTGRRTEEPTTVTRRATFGVFGAILPGAAVVAFGIALVIAISFGVAGSLNGAIAGLPAFGGKLFANISLGGAVALAFVALGAIVAVAFGRFFKLVNAVAAALLLVGFVVVAIGTRANIDLGQLSFYVDANQVVVIAVLVALVGVANFNALPKLGSSVGSLQTTWRWIGVATAIVILPLAVFAHFELFFAQNAATNGFDLVNVMLRNTAFGSVVLWLTVLGATFLLANLLQQTLGNLRLLGLNRASRWWSLALVAVVAASSWLAPTWAFWLDSTRVLLVPVAAAAGMAVGETLIRRGSYHEASLLRGYGFYHAIGWVGVAGFIVSSVLGFATLAPSANFAWLGFSGWVTVFAPAIALIAGLVWVGIAMVPVIISQQKAVAEVEERKATLSGFSGFTE